MERFAAAKSSQRLRLYSSFISSKMTICVTGGTGFVGQGVIPELLRNGYRIRALVRSENSAKKLGLSEAEKTNIEFVIGDPCNTDDIARALEGCTALVHLVGIRRHEIKKTGKTYEDIDVGSAVAAAEAMRRTSIKRIILLSAAAIGNSTYVQCKAKAEMAILESSLDWTIVRPSFIVGPGQQWPIIMGPILSLFGLFPGHFGDISRRAGNISRKKLAKAFINCLANNSTIGRILDVPALRNAAD
jgi:uncharacterized protein YbjT (DUF2867 family)